MNKDWQKITKLTSLIRIYHEGTIVHAHGCFDVLHVGHVRYLEAASKLAQILVVTVTPDEFVEKGPGRPVFTAEVRAEVLAALSCVDFVAINEWPTAVEAIAMLRPSIYVKGPEYRGRMTSALEAEEAAVEEVGGQLVFTEGSEEFSTTKILRQLGQSVEQAGSTRG